MDLLHGVWGVVTLADDGVRYRESYLRLPNGGPSARGRVPPEKGLNGSSKFLALTGSPVRWETLPGIGRHAAAQREELLTDGGIRESEQWRGYLETTRDIECNSPSAAASVVAGRSPAARPSGVTDQPRHDADRFGLKGVKLYTAEWHDDSRGRGVRRLADQADVVDGGGGAVPQTMQTSDSARTRTQISRNS